MSNKGYTLFEGFREGVEPGLRRVCSRAPEKEVSREALWCTLFKGNIVEDY